MVFLYLWRHSGHKNGSYLETNYEMIINSGKVFLVHVTKFWEQIHICYFKRYLHIHLVVQGHGYPKLQRGTFVHKSQQFVKFDKTV